MDLDGYWREIYHSQVCLSTIPGAVILCGIQLPNNRHHLVAFEMLQHICLALQLFQKDMGIPSLLGNAGQPDADSLNATGCVSHSIKHLCLLTPWPEGATAKNNYKSYKFRTASLLTCMLSRTTTLKQVFFLKRL